MPLHFRKPVKAALDEDEAMGIISKVPENFHPTHCSRMHVVTKTYGTPRRTIDMRHVNSECTRELNYTIPPFKQAQEVPKR